MLGILFVYFIGKAFYDLAGKYNRHQWGFGILGVVAYYAGSILGAMIVGFVGEYYSEGFIDDVSDRALGAMGIPFGLLTCWLTYVLLRKSWLKPKEISKHTLDSDLIQP